MLARGSESTWRAQSRRGSASRGSAPARAVLSRLYAAAEGLGPGDGRISITRATTRQRRFLEAVYRADQGVLLAEGITEPSRCPPCRFSALRPAWHHLGLGGHIDRQADAEGAPVRRRRVSRRALPASLRRRRQRRTAARRTTRQAPRPVQPPGRTVQRRRSSEIAFEKGSLLRRRRPGPGRSARERDPRHPREALARRRHGEAAVLGWKSAMLQRLRISNLVLIREAKLELAPGLNAITGEPAPARRSARTPCLLLGAPWRRRTDSRGGPTRRTSRPISRTPTTDARLRWPSSRPNSEEDPRRLIFADGSTRAYAWGGSASARGRRRRRRGADRDERPVRAAAARAAADERGRTIPSPGWTDVRRRPLGATCSGPPPMRS